MTMLSALNTNLRDSVAFLPMKTYTETTKNGYRLMFKIATGFVGKGGVFSTFEKAQSVADWANTHRTLTLSSGFSLVIAGWNSTRHWVEPVSVPSTFVFAG